MPRRRGGLFGRKVRLGTKFLRKATRRARLYGRRRGGFRNPQRVEYKCVDSVLSQQPYSQGGTGVLHRFQLINGVIPGSGVNNRIGRKIFLRSVYFRGESRITNSVKHRGATCRMILLFDKQANGTSPTLDSVLKEFTKDGSATTDYSSPINISNAARYTILLDKQFSIQNYSSVYNLPLTNESNGALKTYLSGGVVSHRWYKKMNLFTQYNEGVAGTIADINSGALWMLYICNPPVDNLDDGDNLPIIDCTVRLRYTD